MRRIEPSLLPEVGGITRRVYASRVRKEGIPAGYVAQGTMVGYIHPGIYARYTTPGTPSSLHARYRPPSLQCPCDELTAVEHRVVELTVGERRVTVVPCYRC